MSFDEIISDLQTLITTLQNVVVAVQALKDAAPAVPKVKEVDVKNEDGSEEEFVPKEPAA